jgi:hypothetical protein
MRQRVIKALAAFLLIVGAVVVTEVVAGADADQDPTQTVVTPDSQSWE